MALIVLKITLAIVWLLLLYAFLRGTRRENEPGAAFARFGSFIGMLITLLLGVLYVPAVWGL